MSINGEQVMTKMKWPWSQSETPTVPETRKPTVTAIEQSTVESIISRSAVAVVEPEPEIPSRFPPRKPIMQDEEMSEYERISKEIGIDCCNDLIREKLLRCLRDESIEIYNYKKVITFLDQKLGDDWEWRGLRTVDAAELGGWLTEGEPRKVQFSSEPYRGAVPLPVLLTVQKIQKAVPEVFFYVSAPKGNDGDPFLCVTSRQLAVYVIERWDEPNFRER